MDTPEGAQARYPQASDPQASDPTAPHGQPWYGQASYPQAPYPQASYPQPPYATASYPTAPYPTASWSPAGPAPRPRRRVRRVAWAGVAVAVVAVGAGLGVHAATAPSATTGPAASGSQGSDTGWSRTPRGGWSGGWGGFGGGGSSGTGTTTTTTTEATNAQQTGVVDIDVVLGGTQRAAGTGMVLTSNGEILTNRHVVRGETAISVTVPATGRTYTARVVGISTTTDVAVVQLVNASGLATVRAASDGVQIGATVVGVGNAGGTGGTPSAATGSVTGLDQTITASDTDGSDPEQLTGLIETDAPIQPGDSGGPLLDASGAVVGMDTAGSARGNDAYAVPIATARTVAHQIEAGGSGTQAGAGTSAQARRPHLGIEVQDTPSGVVVAGVVEGSPAAAAGLEAGDVISSVAGHRIGSTDDLAAVMSSLSAGRSVTVTWIGPDGSAHSVRVTPTAAQA